jgi:CO/xanthine dehydrogenase Mo-binding subunit
VPATLESHYVEHEQSNGPFGAKGVGEVATFCVGPALANAIDDAVGVRIMEMPLKAETVFRAIRAKMGKPLEDE